MSAMHRLNSKEGSFPLILVHDTPEVVVVQDLGCLT